MRVGSVLYTWGSPEPQAGLSAPGAGMGNVGAHLSSLREGQQLNLEEHSTCVAVALNLWCCPVVTKNVGINQTNMNIRRQGLLYSQRLGGVWLLPKCTRSF